MTLICLFLTVNVFANDQQAIPKTDTLKEKFIGSFIKTFAKTYVATHNLDKFKEKNKKKILKMNEEKFQRVYAKIYSEIMVDLPQSLKDMCGISKEMTREKAIAQLYSFNNKKEIYKIINLIPNKMIAKHFEKNKEEFNKTMKRDGSGVDGTIDQLLIDPSKSS